MSRTLAEPKISPQAARTLAVVGLRAFAASTFGRSLPPDEAVAVKQARADALMLANDIDAGTYRGPLLLEVRGYDLDSKGRRGENDRNVWDDALIFLGLDAAEIRQCVRIRGNVDPTLTRPGMASKVAPQLYYVHEGPHRTRRGLRQASPVLIDRDGPGQVEYRVSPVRWPYTNIHDDRGAGTGSEGCSTAPPPDYALLYGVAKSAGRIPTVLVDERARRAGDYGPVAAALF